MLYLLRHGQTDWNLQKRLQGQIDIPLNDTGRQMAKDAAVKFHNIRYDVCWCSPLIRARETADLFLQGRDVPIRYDDRIKEIGLGDYEGIYIADIQPGTPIDLAINHPNDAIAEGGIETWAMVDERIASFMEEVLKPELQAGKDVLVVAHGGALKCVIRYIGGIKDMDYNGDPIANCQLMAYDWPFSVERKL